MNLSLNGSWWLFGLEEKRGKNPPFGVLPEIDGAAYAVEAAVPGNCQLDLFRAGLLPEPFFGDNYYQYIRLEHFGWVYMRSFVFDGAGEDETVFLRFDGVDTVADIFLNGVCIGHTEDMLVEHEFDVTGQINVGENSLAVHFFSSVNSPGRRNIPWGCRGTPGGPRSRTCAGPPTASAGISSPG